MDAIIENSNQLHENMMLKEYCMVSDLPTSLAIDAANIEASFNVVYKGKKRARIANCHTRNEKNCNRTSRTQYRFFDVYVSVKKCYVCCIFKRGNMWRTSYAVFGLDNKESKGYVYEIVESVTSAIELLVKC